MTTLNEQQRAVVESTAKNILCLAGAGAGKTHTMIERLRYLVSNGVSPHNILVLTFTNAAATEMRSRYKTSESDETPEFRTFHSFCYNLICTDTVVQSRLGYREAPSIIDEISEKRIRTTILSELSMKIPAKVLDGLVEPSIKDRKALEIYEKQFRKELLKTSQITFDILCYDVCKLFSTNDTSIFPYKVKYKYIFVDEFQDTDPKQYEFICAFKNSNLFVVGDASQCQPAGTKITMADMSIKNIENLSVGDYVMTYNPNEGRYLKSTNPNNHRYIKRVINISSHYADNVVCIKSDTHSTCYTKDHLTYAKIHYEGNEDSYVTYLMSNNNNWWRVGSTKLFLGSQQDAFGPRIRMRNEGANRVWILGVYKSATDAWLNEQLVAYKYGIPQATWAHRNVKFSRDDIAILYDKLGNLSNNALSCLSAYNRDINYPLFTDTDINLHFSKLHMFECRVGNLIPGIFDIVYPETTSNKTGDMILRNHYESIRSIEPQPPQMVYGLDIEDYHNYVGDGILTHNCIYGFRGADSSIIKSLAKSSEWVTYKLDHNYRSTNQICKFANEISKRYADKSIYLEMQSDKSGSKPKIYYYSDLDGSYEDMCNKVQQLEGTTAILARTNREVYAIENILVAHKIPFGTNTTDDHIRYILTSVLDRGFYADFLASLMDMSTYLNYIRAKQLQKPIDIIEFIIKNYANGYMRHIAHKVDMISSLINESFSNATSAASTCQRIIQQFNHSYTNMPVSVNNTANSIIQNAIAILETISKTNSSLYVGTIHSVKGLEYDNVIVTGVCGDSFKLSNEEMNNLYYVACTRAKSNLIIYEYQDETPNDKDRITYTFAEIMNKIEKEVRSQYANFED